MENKDKGSDNLVGRESVLNVEGQKELIDYQIKATQRLILRIYFVVFPLVFFFVGGMIFILFKFLR